MGLCSCLHGYFRSYPFGMTDRLVYELQSQMLDLTRKVSSLSEEIVVLRDVLTGIGIFRAQTFVARVHRRRFNAIKVASNWSSQVCFEDTLSVPELASSLPVLISPYEVLS